MRFNLAGALVGVSAFALLGGVAQATETTYTSMLQDINNLGAAGQATLVYDDEANTLLVNIQATGLTAGQVHVQHIHGLFDDDGNPVDSKVPTSLSDTDGDGFIELAEAFPDYGPILLGLSDPAGVDVLGSEGGFPTAPDGTIDFSFSYDLTADIFAGDFGPSDLFSLVLREIVIHGAFVDGTAGAGTDGEIDGTAGYKATLPVLVGEISEVPIPAAGLLFLSGAAALPWLRRRKKKAAPAAATA